MSAVRAILPRLAIETTRGKTVMFRAPYLEQQEVLDAIEDHQFVCVVKPRQTGISTIVTSYVFARMLEAHVDGETIHALLTAHERDSSSRLLRFLRTYRNNLPARPGLVASNKKEMVFADRRGEPASSARVLTAGAKSEGRSETIQIAVLDELAYWPAEAQGTYASIISSVDDTAPDNRVICLSTPDGPGNDFHSLVLTARDDPEWRLLFFPWWAHQRYQREAPAGWRVEHPLVQRHCDQHHLSRSQAYWMWRKLQTMGQHALFRFPREFPGDLDEGFASASGTFFHSLPTCEPWRGSGPCRLYTAPDPACRYVVSLDTSGGVGADSTAIAVLNHRYETALVHEDPFLGASAAADLAAVYGRRYAHRGRPAEIIVESNNHGKIALERLRTVLGYWNLYQDVDGKDWWSTDTTKLKMYENARALMPLLGPERIRDQRVVDQLGLMKEDHGRIVAPITAHDDCATAWALGLWAAGHLPAPAPEEPDRPNLFEQDGAW